MAEVVLLAEAQLVLEVELVAVAEFAVVKAVEALAGRLAHSEDAIKAATDIEYLNQIQMRVES